MPEGTSSVCPGLERERRGEARAQIEARAAGRGVMRKLLAQPRIEDFDFDGFHAW